MEGHKEFVPLNAFCFHAANIASREPAGKEPFLEKVTGQSRLVGTPRCGVRTAQRAVPPFFGPPSQTDYCKNFPMSSTPIVVLKFVCHVANCRRDKHANIARLCHRNETVNLYFCP
jgi:hypothetical protein